MHTVIKNKATGRKAVIMQSKPTATVLTYILNKYGWHATQVQIKYPKLKHLTHAKAN
jgi:hypothetical protein